MGRSETSLVNRTTNKDEGQLVLAVENANGAAKVSKRMFGNYVNRVSMKNTVSQEVLKDIQTPALPNENLGRPATIGSPIPTDRTVSLSQRTVPVLP